MGVPTVTGEVTFGVSEATDTGTALEARSKPMTSRAVNSTLRAGLAPRVANASCTLGETPLGRGLLCQSPGSPPYSGCRYSSETGSAVDREVGQSIRPRSETPHAELIVAIEILGKYRVQRPVGQRRDEAEHLVDFVFESSEETELTAGAGASRIRDLRIHVNDSVRLPGLRIRGNPNSSEVRERDVDRRTAADRICREGRKKRDCREIITCLRICLQRSEIRAVREVAKICGALTESRGHQLEIDRHSDRVGELRLKVCDRCVDRGFYQRGVGIAQDRGVENWVDRQASRSRKCIACRSSIVDG